MAWSCSPLGAGPSKFDQVAQGQVLSSSKDGQLVTSLVDLSRCLTILVERNTSLVLKEHISLYIYPSYFTICISDFSVTKLLVIALYR